MDLDLSCINVKHKNNANTPICHLLFNQTAIIKNRSTSSHHKKQSAKKPHGLKLMQSSKLPISQQPHPNLQNKKYGNMLRMSQIKERIIGIDNSKANYKQNNTFKEIIESNLKIEKPTEVNINKTNQCTNSFDYQVSWKTPQLSYFIQNHNPVLGQQPINTIRTQKNSRQSTDASTQLVFSTEISRQGHNQTESTIRKTQIPRWIQNIKSEKSLLETSQISLGQNKLAADSRVEVISKQIFDLRQVSSFTKTISHHSTPSNQNFVLDQSMVEWTYQTGFKDQDIK